MGKTQKKTGKGRIDKYYKLAKEQGYRARSAFKLIQLNKKYEFLESSKCCIDLCAAPGGWLQVASKYMPVNSIIIGVDLVPIKPIPRVTTFAADITTPNCRNLIRNELKDWKADVVLHDGAPNVGTAWVQDAYSQSELVLMSLKLAVEFLIKGGTFVTKIFRSADYNNLIWVFNQLFGKVEATKPPASRNVSAEIFVVCREFHAPKHIDPKFLDPKHVFKELAPSSSSLVDKGTSANNAHANVFMPEKKRRKRDGYDEGDYTLHKTLSASDFIKGSDAVQALGPANQITFTSSEEREWLKNEVTTAEIRANCEDLKVLGKGDFKALMKWRTALREELGLEMKEKPVEEFTETVEIVDEEENIQAELEKLNAEASARDKRDRRRANEQKRKNILRMQLQMTAPMDIGQELEDATLKTGQEDMFDLNIVEKKRVRLQNKETAEMSDSDASSDDESTSGSEDGRVDRLERDLDGMYETYKTMRSERDAKFKVKEQRKKNKDREETWGGIRQKDGSDSSDPEVDSGSEEGGWEELQERKELDNDSSSDESSEEDSSPFDRKRPRSDTEDDEEVVHPSKRKRLESGSNKKLLTKLTESKGRDDLTRKADMWFSQPLFSGMDDFAASDSDAEMSGDEGSINSQDSFEVVPQGKDEDIPMWDVDNEDLDKKKQEKITKFGLITAEAMTLAQQLVNREKTKTQLINDGFHRYSLNSKEGLPSWFVDDEAKFYKPNLPITKEAVRALREKQRALDARPIKKIAEAKARKKLKAAQQLEKARQKAEGVNQTKDMTEKEKASQIEKLMSRGLSKRRKKDQVQLVVAKGPNRGLRGRPKGVKGRYRMVDARGKKELRAEKRRAKDSKRRK